MKIKTHYEQQPIPLRQLDWSAVDDDSDDEGGAIGFGKTEIAAMSGTFCPAFRRSGRRERRAPPQRGNATADRDQRGFEMKTSQQEADELLADHQAERNIERVTEAIVQAEQEVRFYQQSIISLESAVWKIKKHFTDPRMVKVWFDEIETCRDVLSRILDKAEGKLR